MYDACGRRCECQNGKLVKCCRLRKEFTDMTYTERVRYINTVKTASMNQPYKKDYETLLKIHKTFFSIGRIHERHFFLPWHRWFILQYENLLQQIDCRVTVPYWDWSLVAASPFSNSFWSNGANGFGGNGRSGDRCVNTGPFRREVWKLPASAAGNCLKRQFSNANTFPNAVTIRASISDFSNPHQFADFELMLRGSFHGTVHCLIHGTMCTHDSATAPEFFLHHGFIDKIWGDWQKQSLSHQFHTYFLTQTEDMTSTPHRSRDFLDLSNQPGCVCAEYVEPKNSMAAMFKGEFIFR